MEKYALKGTLQLLFVVVTCILIFDSIVYANTSFIAEITVDSLNVRNQPNTKGDVIGKFNKGDQVKVSHTQSGWAKTLFHGETIGYFSTNYMKKVNIISSEVSSVFDVDEKMVYGKFFAEITADSLNVRDQPDTKGNVIGKVNKGEQIIASSSRPGWAITLFHGETPGYVSTEYMKVVRIIYSEDSSAFDDHKKKVKCNAVTAALGLNNSKIDLKCEENLSGDGVKSCVAWFNVSISSDCNERMSAIVDCDAEFKYETQDGVTPNQVSESGLGTVYLVYGRGNGLIQVPWSSAAILEPVISVQMNTGSCSIISSYDY
jgi:uncharacterized protein YgiM (DUF1202 family)